MCKVNPSFLVKVNISVVLTLQKTSKKQCLPLIISSIVCQAKFRVKCQQTMTGGIISGKEMIY